LTFHIRWQVLLILLGIVLVGVLLTYLAFNYTTVLRPGPGGTYVEGIAGFPQHLNPLLCDYNQVDSDLCALLFSGLTELNQYGEIQPDLAREWEVALDSKSYTFRLRPNAYWHDGHPVTAEDVMFTVDLLKSDGFLGPTTLGASLWKMVTVERIDRLTVRFTLEEPYAPFLDYTTFGLLPAHLLQGTRASDLRSLDFNLNPIGTGPFQMEELEAEEGVVSSIVLKPFDRYYGQGAYLDRIQFRFYPSHQQVLDAYQSQEVEGIGYIPPALLPEASEAPSLDVYSARTAEFSAVMLNLAREDLAFFQDPDVRRGLMYALDRQEVINKVLHGQGVVAHSPFVPGTWAYREDLPHYTHDPRRAAELFEAAGWERRARGPRLSNEEGSFFEFTLLTTTDPERVAVAERLARQWDEAGLDVRVTKAPAAEVREALEAREFEAVLVSLDMPGDPDPYPFWHEMQIEDGQNYAGFEHRRISEIIEQARIRTNRERRRQLYDEYQALFMEEVPALLLYLPVYNYGVDQRINDVQIPPLMDASDRFRTISEWWIVPRRVFISESETIEQ